MNHRSVAAGVFKQGCLALLDEVAEGNVEIIVTTRGRPVARLVPMVSVEEQEAETLARLRRQSRVVAGDDELMAPSSHSERWRLSPPTSRR
jgi:prevent-host-death family protein